MLFPQIFAWLTHFLQVLLKCPFLKEIHPDYPIKKNVTSNLPNSDPLYFYFSYYLFSSDLLYTLFIIILYIFFFIVYLPPLEINWMKAGIFESFVPSCITSA